MTGILDRIRERARANRKRIVFPEIADPRVHDAAAILRRDGLCEPILLTDELVAQRLGVYAAHYLERRRHKGVEASDARAAPRLANVPALR